MTNIANMKNYLTFAIVAVLAGSIGWGVSALGVNKKSEAVTPQAVTAPLTNQLVPTAVPVEQLSSEPLRSAAPTIVSEALPSPVQVPKPIKRSAASRSRAVNRSAVATAPAAGESDSARNNESESSGRSTLPVRERKSGMSNTTKTVLAIGGGAATGAIIGGLAGGKKGAAIGAIAGGGGGAIYSLIRKKQGKEVWE